MSFMYKTVTRRFAEESQRFTEKNREKLFYRQDAKGAKKNKKPLRSSRLRGKKKTPRNSVVLCVLPRSGLYSSEFSLIAKIGLDKSGRILYHLSQLANIR
jgi:hypothetical protein